MTDTYRIHYDGYGRWAICDACEKSYQYDADAQNCNCATHEQKVLKIKRRISNDDDSQMDRIEAKLDLILEFLSKERR